MTTEDSLITGLAERELMIARVFNASRPLLFKAWTQPEHMLGHHRGRFEIFSSEERKI